MSQAKAQTRETDAFVVSGFLSLIVELAILAAGITLIRLSWPLEGDRPTLPLLGGIGLLLVALVMAGGFFIVQPNHSRVVTLFGRYVGSVRSNGWFWTNPFTLPTRTAISLRVRNFASEMLKVNDQTGNPIEIAAVIVWRVVDTARASFDVENYSGFVKIQSETAIRHLAQQFPYDSQSDDERSLRGDIDAISQVFTRELQDRLEVAGVEVIEARLSHLAYAPEIAGAMLRRQQAAAIVAARQTMVEGAVGMVEMALDKLQREHIVELDEEKKAAMVSNLLVVLTGDHGAQPVLNTGTLYH